MTEPNGTEQLTKAAGTLRRLTSNFWKRMISAWFSPHIPLRIKAKKFYLGLIRQEDLIYHHLGVL